MNLLEKLKEKADLRTYFKKRALASEVAEYDRYHRKVDYPVNSVDKVKAVLDSLVKNDVMTSAQAKVYRDAYADEHDNSSFSTRMNVYDFIDYLFEELGDDVYKFDMCHLSAVDTEMLRMKLHTSVLISDKTYIMYIPSVKKLAPKYRELAKAKLQKRIDERAEVEKQYHEELELYKKVLKGKEIHVEVYNNMERALEFEGAMYDGIVSFFNERMKGSKNNEI